MGRKDIECMDIPSFGLCSRFFGCLSINHNLRLKLNGRTPFHGATSIKCGGSFGCHFTIYQSLAPSTSVRISLRERRLYPGGFTARLFGIGLVAPGRVPKSNESQFESYEFASESYELVYESLKRPSTASPRTSRANPFGCAQGASSEGFEYWRL